MFRWQLSFVYADGNLSCLKAKFVLVVWCCCWLLTSSPQPQGSPSSPSSNASNAPSGTDHFHTSTSTDPPSDSPNFSASTPSAYYFSPHPPPSPAPSPQSSGSSPGPRQISAQKGDAGSIGALMLGAGKVGGRIMALTLFLSG